MKQQNNKKFAIYIGEQETGYTFKVKKTFNSRNEAMQYYKQTLKPLFEDLFEDYENDIEIDVEE